MFNFNFQFNKGGAQCNCNGWKNPNPQRTSEANNIGTQVNLSTSCRACQHPVSDHVSHLDNETEEEVNYLLSMVVDVENLFMCVHKETDNDNKQVYFYLFKLLRKSILQMTKPSVEGPLGKPPFEAPSIEKVIILLNILSLFFSKCLKIC